MAIVIVNSKSLSKDINYAHKFILVLDIYKTHIADNAAFHPLDWKIFCFIKKKSIYYITKKKNITSYYSSGSWCFLGKLNLKEKTSLCQRTATLLLLIWNLLKIHFYFNNKASVHENFGFFECSLHRKSHQNHQLFVIELNTIALLFLNDQGQFHILMKSLHDKNTCHDQLICVLLY